MTWILCLGAPSVDCTTGVSMHSECPGSYSTSVQSIAPPEPPEESFPWGLTSDISNGF